MPKKATKSYHFSFMDFFIIVGLAIAVCALIFVVSGRDIKELTAEKVEVSYILYIDSAYVDEFSVGDQIFTKNGKNAGTVTSVSTSYTDSSKTVVIVSAVAYSVKKELFIDGQMLALSKGFSVSLGNDVVIDTLCAGIAKVS